MSKRQHTSQPTMTLSAYLSLRQAVRPAIFAHSLLAGDQERAGTLAGECDSLLKATRELLKAAGLVHILTPEPGPEMPDTSGGDRRAQLLDAYADAGMLWAQVVGSSLVLAETLARHGRWDEVRRLAGFLHDAGEANTAMDLLSRLGKAIWDKYREQLKIINNQLSRREIRKAIDLLRDALREVPEAFPERNREINRFLAPLAASIYTQMEEEGFEDMSFSSRVEHIAEGGVAKYPDIVAVSLDELAAEFESAVRRNT
jgi:hypothetical protein